MYDSKTGDLQYALSQMKKGITERPNNDDRMERGKPNRSIGSSVIRFIANQKAPLDSRHSSSVLATFIIFL